MHDIQCQNYYPHQAIQNNEYGVVGLCFHVETDGSIKDLSVGQSSGFADLDAVAIQCAEKWRYTPPLRNAVPIEMPWRVRVGFFTHSTAGNAKSQMSDEETAKQFLATCGQRLGTVNSAPVPQAEPAPKP